MNYWLINLSREKVFLSKDRNSNKSELTIMSKRNIRIEKNDLVIFIEKFNNQANYLDYKFLNIGEVVDAILIDEQDQIVTPKKKIGKIKQDDALSKIGFYIINPVKELSHNLTLRDFAYTLQGIRNFENPEKHFNYNYRKINHDNFECIVEGQIFVSRTVFGKILNSLPHIHRLQFMNYVSDFEIEESRFLNRADYIKAFGLLKDYINDYILKLGNYLVRAYSDIYDNFKDVPIEELCFTNGDAKVEENAFTRNRNAYKMINQVRKFEKLFEYQDESFWERVASVLEEYSLQEKLFNNKFDSNAWPVQLK